MKRYKILKGKNRVSEKGSVSGAVESGRSPPGWCLPGRQRLRVSYHAGVYMSTKSSSLLNPRYLCVHQPINNHIIL